MAVNGVGGVLVSDEKVLAKLAADHERFSVVSLDWLDEDRDEELERDLAYALGAMFAVESIQDRSGERRIEPAKGDPAQRWLVSFSLVRSVVTRLRAKKLNLWLDHGDRDELVGDPSGPRFATVVSPDLKYYFEFRVLREGKVVPRSRRSV